ncbi:MAG: YdcF family protein [Planctomycetes bacterium]|nr:YdcF family protein [Planctomycetota bacterium]
MARILEPLFLPPLNAIVLAFLALVLWRARPRFARGTLIASAVFLVLQMVPLVGHALITSLQVDPALRLEAPFAGTDGSRPRAIVILSAESDPRAPEFGRQTVGRTTLRRVRYGAALARATGLPILTTGGIPPGGDEPISVSMQRCLSQDFGIQDVRWVETKANTTWENATFGAKLLYADGIATIFLVTHAWHMPRARLAFEDAGLRVIAAPTAFEGPPWQGPKSLIPSYGGMRATTLALHEIFGRIYYALFERKSG